MAVDITLLRLNLSNTGLGDEGGVVLEKFLSKNVALTDLDLSWNRLQRCVPNFVKNCKSILTLNLSFQPLGIGHAKPTLKQKMEASCTFSNFGYYGRHIRPVSRSSNWLLWPYTTAGQRHAFSG